jgi:hypothetical protein
MTGKNQAFVIEGERFELGIENISMFSNPVEATCFSNSWREWIKSNRTFVELCGITKNGQEITGTFYLISRMADGTMEICDPIFIEFGR